jgi:hypothetical protein
MAFTIVGDAAVVVGDTSITKQAAIFTGGNTDDAYTCDTYAAAECAANNTTGTFIAWINTGDITSTGSIFCINDNNVVEFVDFKVAAGKVGAAMTDATVARWALATSSIVLQPHIWYHVALVQDGKIPAIYVNGVRQAVTFTVSTAITEWTDKLDGVDNGSIGSARISGDGSYTEEFVGAITGVKSYAAALTADEILADYKGATRTTNLTAWYQMNDLTDSSGNGYSLTAVSDVYLSSYNEFISRVRKFGAVVADSAGLCESMGRATALFINAA